MTTRPKLKAYWHMFDSYRFTFATEEEKKFRVAHIKKHKPKSEVPTRLRLLKAVRGKLPAELVKARDAYEKAKETRAAWNRACDAYCKTLAAYDKALSKHRPAIEALHAKECPDCPWDGYTIFPPKKKGEVSGREE